MFMSTYIPVNMRRANCAVYSAEKVFPEDKLLLAYSFITQHQVDGVFMNDGNIEFIDVPGTIWTIPEVYLAYEAYRQAAMCNFSYYIVKNEEDIPQLFISKSFKGHRLLVNAFTMNTVLLGTRQLVNKVASLIDRTMSSRYCIDLFNTMKAIESNSARFLPALIVDKGTDEEALIVNPVTTCMAEDVPFYGADWIEELRKVYEDRDVETDCVKFVNNGFIRKDLPNSCPALSADHVKFILDLYDKINEKKSNYVYIMDENYEPWFYLSTNNRYLVNARTFECVVIRNQHTKSLLMKYAARGTISADQLNLVWMLAKTE